MIGWVAKLGAEPEQARQLLDRQVRRADRQRLAVVPRRRQRRLAATGQPRHRQRSERRERAGQLQPSSRAGCSTSSRSWGTAPNGGVRYYILDNEPSIWHAHPSRRPPHRRRRWTRSRSRSIDYADADQSGRSRRRWSSGPEEWGWSGYFYSGYDQQYGAAARLEQPARPRQPRRLGLPALAARPAAADTTPAPAQRLLDVFSVHYYPQGGEFGNDTCTRDAAAAQPLDALAVGPELRRRELDQRRGAAHPAPARAGSNTVLPRHADRRSPSTTGAPKATSTAPRPRPTSSASSAAKGSTWRRAGPRPTPARRPTRR